MPLFINVNKNRVINCSFVSFFKAIYFIGWKQQQQMLTKLNIKLMQFYAYTVWMTFFSVCPSMPKRKHEKALSLFNNIFYKQSLLFEWSLWYY